MAKRFTDTDKWKKPFIRGLQGPYKLLWLYILDDCDLSGVWEPDIEVAEIRIGEKFDAKKALELFGDRVRVHGGKWFIPDFISFQYGELKSTNRMHCAVTNMLTKHKILASEEGASEPLTRAQGQEQGKGNGQGQEEGQGQKRLISKLDVFESLFSDQQYIDQLSLTHKGKDLKQAFEECYTHHSNGPNPPQELWEWRQKLNTWLTIKKTEYNGGKGNNKKGNADRATAQAVIEAYSDVFRTGSNGQGSGPSS